MTFEFTVGTGLLFFLSWGFAFLIIASDSVEVERTVSGCSLHPGTDTCAHRKKKE